MLPDQYGGDRFHLVTTGRAAKCQKPLVSPAHCWIRLKYSWELLQHPLVSVHGLQWYTVVSSLQVPLTECNWTPSRQLYWILQKSFQEFRIWNVQKLTRSTLIWCASYKDPLVKHEIKFILTQFSRQKFSVSFLAVVTVLPICIHYCMMHYGRMSISVAPSTHPSWSAKRTSQNYTNCGQLRRAGDENLQKGTRYLCFVHLSGCNNSRTAVRIFMKWCTGEFYKKFSTHSIIF